MKHTNIEYNGVVYADRKALGLAFGLTAQQITCRLNKGWSLERTLTTPMAEPARPKEVTFDGITYPSLSALCREKGVDALTVQRRMDKGATVKEAIAGIKERVEKMAVVYKGVKYNSKTALFKKLGLSESVMARRLQSGMTLEEAIETPIIPNHKVLTYKGKNYYSLAALGRDYGIPMDVMHHRYESGWTIEKIVETPIRDIVHDLTVTYKGKTYTTTELAKKAGMTRDLLYERIFTRGLSVEEAVETPVRQNSISIEFEGVKYESLKDLADAYNISADILRIRHKKGWSIEDAVRTPLAEYSVSIEFEGKTFPSLSELARAYNVNKSTLINRHQKGWSIHECVYGRKRTDKRGKQIDKMMEEILFENAISKRKNTGAYQNAVSNIIAVNSAVV